MALALYDAQTQALMMGSSRYLELVVQANNKTPDDVIRCSWQEVTLLTPVEDAMEHWKNVVESRTPFHIPELAITFGPDKSETVWDYDLTPIITREDEEKVRYVLVSLVEITKHAHQEPSGSASLPGKRRKTG